MARSHRFILFFLLPFAVAAQVTPTAAIVSMNTNLCTSKPLSFSVSTNADPSSYSWSIYTSSGVSFLSDQVSSVVTLQFSKDLTYTLSVTMESAGGPVLAKTLIRISRTAIASFNASLTSAGHPTELVLTNYSAYSVKNYWVFNPEQMIDSSFNFVKSYTSGGSYKVSLLAIGSKGCNDTLDYVFRISDSSSVVLPNVFTPNADNINDHFKPATTGLQSSNCWIFDRAGYLVYKWTTVNGFWDGRTNAGEPCPEGVYFVVFEGWGFDGKVYKASGTLTLAR